MATAQMTFTVRDLLTPVLLDLLDGAGSMAVLQREVTRRLDDAERLTARLLWEEAWAHATGRPWGWKPRLARVDLTLSPNPMLSEVYVDGAPIAAQRAMIDTRNGKNGNTLLVLEIPMYRDTMSVRSRGT